ncbi:FAD-dependent oxidoreductase [bacterium]|nr:FAD-dependent oxidoreductase [bacterium]
MPEDALGATCPMNRLAEKSAVVVGGGIGGLATALRLRRSGCRVTLLEKNAMLGGKVAERKVNGFRWDLGPSLFTMPQILDRLFADLGEKREDYLSLQPLSPACRYRWADGYQFDENEFFWSRPDSARLLRHAEGLYKLSAPAFLESDPSEIWKKILNPSLLPLLRYLPAMSPFRSLASASRHFPLTTAVTPNLPPPLLPSFPTFKPASEDGIFGAESAVWPRRCLNSPKSMV